MHSVTFRPLERAHFLLLRRWLLEPHVSAWWHETPDLAGIEAKYGPRIDGIEPTHMLVIENHHQPVGWIQWYRWADYPDHAGKLGAGTDAAGIDLAIGEPDMIGTGLGPAAIRACLDHIASIDAGIRTVITDPDDSNLRSVRAFLKAGFRTTAVVQLLGEDCTRRVMARDLL